MNLQLLDETEGYILLIIFSFKKPILYIESNMITLKTNQRLFGRMMFLANELNPTIRLLMGPVPVMSTTGWNGSCVFQFPVSESYGAEKNQSSKLVSGLEHGKKKLGRLQTYVSSHCTYLNGLCPA